MSGKTALLLGATGNTGSSLLLELLASPAFTKIGEYGRRITPSDTLPLPGREKLQQHIIDFENLAGAGLEQEKWDVVFVTLGTTRKLAGSAQDFQRIDRDYVVNAAKHARDPSSTEQRLIYVSAAGANPRSSLLYPRTKGETEHALSQLGYGETIVFRPAMLQGAVRKEPRPAEAVAGAIVGALSWVWDGAAIHVKDLAKAMRIAGQVGAEGLPKQARATKVDGFTVVGNGGALALSNMDL
ncbi:NAD(P)-binding protein [Calocera cornea HHB12733]|uniref:NAD(P)-binding protein n=1 Tax=Calocera cornea HHB12733 TaxID=1353952 RepID=A0A165J7S5_9BASI|nr:NAD(P)-binding protein [Calocera cornea HHB12733]